MQRIRSLLPIISGFVCALACLPCLVTFLNLRFILRSRKFCASPEDAISVLIPARNESRRIASCLESVLVNKSPLLEVIVLDDGSTDHTRDIVASYTDTRLRLINGHPLPKGYNGKSFACAQLAAAARNPILIFMDADVTLAPDALQRLAKTLRAEPDIALVSGVPRQITSGILDWILLPFINAILYGYLPAFIDHGTRPSFSAACGQLIVTDAKAYHGARGHEAIVKRIHDGLALARSMRRQGLRTRIIEASDLAECRMYETAPQVYRGLIKNAMEGMAGGAALPVWFVLLIGGHILPFLLPSSTFIKIARFANVCFRLTVALRCRQNPLCVVTGPIGAFLLLVIQCHARLRHLLRRTVAWKGRHYEI